MTREGKRRRKSRRYLGRRLLHGPNCEKTKKQGGVNAPESFLRHHLQKRPGKRAGVRRSKFKNDRQEACFVLFLRLE